MKKILTTIIIPIIAFIGLMCVSNPIAVASSKETEIEIITVVENIGEAAQLKLGDVNGDGYINAVDASQVLNAYAKFQTGEEPLTPLQKEAADVNKDGSIDSIDSSIILSYYAYLATTEDSEIIPIEDFINTDIEESEESEEIPVIIEEKIFYKPATHYIHTESCHWVNEDCYEEIVEIKSTDEIECRKCTECNPTIEIKVEYKEPIIENVGISDYDRQLLAEIVWHEAGSNWISQYNKAKVVAGVMNRVNDARFPNTVYSVLVAPNQFTGYWPGCCTPTQACYDAVDYYFTHTSEFNSDNSWWGDGYQNHFYYQ